MLEARSQKFQRAIISKEDMQHMPEEVQQPTEYV